jgi:3-hydroxybutyryl-CoA dehydrogenase
MPPQTVGVVGCGLMGAGIAQVAATAGFDVVVREVDDALLKKGLGALHASLANAVEKGKLDAGARDQALRRLRGTTALAELASCDVMIEAIVENLEAKRTLFRELDRVVKPGALLCSNTSSLSVTEMAAATSRPERFVGLHFFNPVPLMPLVEIVRGLRTSEPAVAEARAFAAALGKKAILAPDAPGFIVNRLLIPYLLEAIRAFEAGLATREDLDEGMRLGCGHPMGPLTLLDFVGLDTTLWIAEIMFREFGDPRFAAPPLLRRMVAAGHLGKKSGRGFYEYGTQKESR